MRLLRFLFALTVASLGPAYAQFSFTVQQNGQATTTLNGSNIPLNAPAPGQTATAMLTLTYLGVGTVQFQTLPMVIGPTDFTVSNQTPFLTLDPLQSVNLDITYTARVTTLQSAQLFWPFNQLTAPTPTNPVPVVFASGAISFNLIGTAPSTLVGQLSATGSFVTVPNGGTIQFPDTLLYNANNLTISIVNSGSGAAVINSISTTTNEYQFLNLPLLPLTLNAGSQFTATLRFVPIVAGAANSSLQIAFGTGAYAAAITGKGISSLLGYQLTQNNTTSPLQPNQTIPFSDTATGGQSTVTIEFQNTTQSAVQINQAVITGAGFSLVNPPFFPVTLAPQQSSAITVAFSPTQPGPAAGRLAIGGDSFLLTGNGLGTVFQYSYQIAGASSTVLPGGSITLPTIAVAQTQTFQFTVTNTGTQAGSIFSIAIPSSSFQLGALPSLPLQLNPNGSVTFPITFTAPTSGQSTATLLVNSQSFTLVGTATSLPALPTYHFTGATSVLPFQQPAIGLSLDAPYPLPITGSLTMSLSSTTFVTDPAVQFSTSGRTVAFTIPANTVDAVFPTGSTQIRIQTGTLAETIQITPAFSTTNGTSITPFNPASLQLTVPVVAPVLLSAVLGNRTLTGFTVTVSGYTTTRYLDHLDFQLTPSSGSTLQATSFRVDVSGASRIFYQSGASQNIGGQFLLDIPFTIFDPNLTSGLDATRNVGSISVTVVNDVGSSSTLKIVVP